MGNKREISGSFWAHLSGLNDLPATAPTIEQIGNAGGPFPGHSAPLYTSPSGLKHITAIAIAAIKAPMIKGSGTAFEFLPNYIGGMRRDLLSQ